MAAHTGQVTVTTPGTPVRGPAITVHTILLRALSTNSGACFVGRAQAEASATTGFVLAPTDPAIRMKVNNMQDLWFDAASGGSKVSWFSIDD